MAVSNTEGGFVFDKTELGMSVTVPYVLEMTGLVMLVEAAPRRLAARRRDREEYILTHDSIDKIDSTTRTQ